MHRLDVIALTIIAMMFAVAGFLISLRDLPITGYAEKRNNPRISWSTWDPIFRCETDIIVDLKTGKEYLVIQSSNGLAVTPLLP